MKRIFSNPATALVAALGLRLYFVLKHPAEAGDSVLYEQIATNWLQHHVYAMNVNDAVTPVDLRMPGYPAFLALIYAVAGRSGPGARLYVMLAQAAIDLCTCLLTAVLAAMITLLGPRAGTWNPAFAVTLWLAALCPFTANYVAVPLTEVFAGFLTAAALVPALALIWNAGSGRAALLRKVWAARHAESILAFLFGFLVGLGTLFRPEAPLLLLAAWIVCPLVWLKKHRIRFMLRLAALSIAGCALPLFPWALRNAVTLHEFQALAPRNSNLPGELVPYGFMAWEKTWLFRVKDCYLVSWKLNGEVINFEDLPQRAFDTAEEQARVAMILEQYNNEVTLSPEEDAAFARLARERTARNPTRTYLWLPLARAFTIWFTPRIELLPFSGNIFPIKQTWEDDPVDFSFTAGFFLLNVAYVALALWGAWRLMRAGAGPRFGVALLLAFILLRTVFLTTLETPEPRYVLVCFPAILALAGHVFVRQEFA